jgi:F-type H+-transporting ATPase subunit a
MNPVKNRTTEEVKQNRAGVPARFVVAVALGSLAAACWLLPVRAQEHAPPPPPPPSAADEHAPPAAGGQKPPPHAAPRSGGEAAPGGHAAPGGSSQNPETGSSHEGPAEHGPGGTHGPEGGTHEAGTPKDGHGQGAEGHGAEGGHGEKHEEEFSIHLPTWIYGALKRIWYSGPANLSADGVIGASPAEIKGKRAEGFVYHAHGGGEFRVNPTLVSVGESTKASPGEKTETVMVNGRQVTLINPKVTFVLEGMFPEALVISLLTALAVFLLGFLLTRNMKLVPDRKQTVVEMIYGALDNFVHQLIGPTYKKYVPLVATAFLYILIMNLSGLIPGWTSPTGNVNVTAGLALVVVVYVQIEGIRANGFLGYLKHFMGEPLWLAPLNFPLHIIGEFARLLSLTIRLFGNIFGEDVVIVILIALAIQFTRGWVPAQAPMYLMAIFTSFVQAMVFSILTCVYIALMTTHEDHGEHHGEHGHGDDHGLVREVAPPAPAV